MDLMDYVLSLTRKGFAVSFEPHPISSVVKVKVRKDELQREWLIDMYPSILSANPMEHLEHAIRTCVWEIENRPDIAMEGK